MDGLKRLFMFALPISFLTLFFGICSFSEASAQNIILPEEGPIISDSGTAEREVLADESRISLAVENTNTDANSARKNNADKMDSIIKVLQQNGLTNKNITT